MLRLATDAAGGGRGSASCRPPAATPPSRSAASTRPSASGPASPPTSRSSASAPTDRAARPPARQDLIYVGGGSLRQPARGLGGARHRRDPQPRLAAGIVLAGQSAGAMCWFEAGHHQVFGQAARRRRASACSPAASASTTTTNRERRAAYLERGRRTGLPGGYGLDDYAGPALGGHRPPSRSPPSAAPARYRSPRAKGSRVRRTAGPLPAPLPPRALREDIAEFRRITACARRAAGLG
jgi:hypothetical protein